MSMLKKLFIFFVFFVSSIFTSCNWYVSSIDESFLISKDTIKNFSSLKEPIVISLPVYDTLKFCNSEKWTQKKQLGDIIAVIDVETDSVYDWIFFSDEYGWGNWRLAEVSVNPTKYVMSTFGSGEVVSLSSDGTRLEITNTGLPEFVWLCKSVGKYVPICIGRAANKFDINLFDVFENKVTNTFVIETDGIGYMASSFESDSEGDFYFTAKIPDEWKSYLYKIDVENMVLEKVVCLDMQTMEGNDTVAQVDNLLVAHVSDKNIYLIRYPLGKYTHDLKVFVVEKNTGNIVNEYVIPADNDDHYLYDIMFINNELYVIALVSGSDLIKLYKINEENDSVQSFGAILDFDMTENIYVRGNRIYFMNSRNISDIKFVWYDVSTGEIGPEKRICVSDFIN